MGEIEFRAWDRTIKQMLPNVQNHINDPDWAFGRMLRNPDRFDVMQFIGIKDKNEKKVFVGDRIRIYWRLEDDDFTDETITYDNKYCYFKYGNNPICELFDPAIPFEVIGNTHQIAETIHQQ